MNPHHNSPVYTAGADLSEAHAAVILLPGRGAPAGSLLPLVDALARPGVAFLLPEAEGLTWYPYPFLVTSAQNEPWLSGALAKVASVLDDALQAGVPARQVLLGGFSQGACLALEFAARHPQRYGGLAGLSGGLIGADDEAVARPGSFDGTPAYLGCGVPDPHIPKSRVDRTAKILEQMGASVTTHLFPGLGHTINDTELEALQALLANLL